MQAIVEQYAESNKIRDAGTVQSVALIGGIYASCVATMIFADAHFAKLFNNLLRWETFFCLIIVNLLVVVFLPAEGEDRQDESIFAFISDNWGRSARSGIVAMNVVVLRSAFPLEDPVTAQIDGAIGKQILILVATGLATATLTMIGAAVWHKFALARKARRPIKKAQPNDVDFKIDFKPNPNHIPSTPPPQIPSIETFPADSKKTNNLQLI